VLVLVPVSFESWLKASVLALVWNLMICHTANFWLSVDALPESMQNQVLPTTAGNDAN